MTSIEHYTIHAPDRETALSREALEMINEDGREGEASILVIWIYHAGDLLKCYIKKLAPEGEVPGTSCG